VEKTSRGNFWGFGFGGLFFPHQSGGGRFGGGFGPHTFLVGGTLLGRGLNPGISQMQKAVWAGVIWDFAFGQKGQSRGGRLYPKDPCGFLQGETENTREAGKNKKKKLRGFLGEAGQWGPGPGGRSIQLSFTPPRVARGAPQKPYPVQRASEKKSRIPQKRGKPGGKRKPLGGLLSSKPGQRTVFWLGGGFFLMWR